MRSLFFRIFVTFWIATSIITLAFGFIYQATSTNDRWERWQFMHEHVLRAHLRDEASKLVRGGPEVLEEVVEELRSHTEMHITIVDTRLPFAASGLPDVDDPEQVVQALGRQAVSEGHALQRRFERSAYFAEPLNAMGPGRALVGEVRRPSGLFWYLGPPETRPLRLAAILVVSGCICYALARHLTHRIRIIRQGSRRLAAGDLSSRIAPKLAAGEDEANALAKDLDMMAERIAGLLAAQQQLLRDVSHELRSPLARLSVALELAREASDPERAELHDRIAKEAARLEQLIGEVLTLTRLEAGAPEARHAHALNLLELVQEVARDANFEAQPNRRRVEVLATEPITLVGFAEVLRPAVENVVRNAVAFAPTGTDVEVRLERSLEGGRDWAKICVRDRGPGVPEAALESIFRP
ncbi:MAG TPA: histidine kinase dimerization/phospho-acceptor domain-containing protein, partial [Polyangiaceae bacterium]|nr:histidine kinase dimerization/phospho-acceptor domain-containing protein [Polyangiaceae bacterium]